MYLGGITADPWELEAIKAAQQGKGAGIVDPGFSVSPTLTHGVVWGAPAVVPAAAPEVTAEGAAPSAGMGVLGWLAVGTVGLVVLMGMKRASR